MKNGLQVLIRRNEPVTGPAGPIVVCTRNDDLQAIVEATPAARREDLVFIQNGMLQPWLDAQGLGDNTQVSWAASDLTCTCFTCSSHTTDASFTRNPKVESGRYTQESYS